MADPIIEAGGSGFLEALSLNPYDHVCRLVFADWLEERGFDDEALVQRAWTVEKQKAEDWLRNFAASQIDLSYEQLIEAGKDAGDPECVFIPGESGTRQVWLTDFPEFWDHWETVTTEDRPEAYDGCSGCYDDSDY